MIVRCPNEACNTKMSIKDEVVRNSDANVKCPSCKKMFKPFNNLPQYLKDEILNTQKTDCDDSRPNKRDSALGWLIVHDEKTHTQTYDLYEGVQTIGRKSNSRPCDVMIETADNYMSRNHFIIEVINNRGCFHYVLKDAQATNRTYVEVDVLSEFIKKLRPLNKDEEVYIEDGDIIQAGKTKIILKTPKSVPNREIATQIVTNQDIAKTVIV